MSVTLAIETSDEERVLLVPVHEGEYAGVGTVAEVTGSLQLPGGAHAVTLQGLHRGIAGAASTGADGRLRVEVDERPDENPPRVRTAELEREYRATVEEILELRDADPRIRDFVRAISEAGALADTTAYAPDVGFDEKVQLLETIDVVERLELAVRLQRERLAELQVRRRIREDVESGAQRQQREYILRRQMDSIRKELGEDDGSADDDRTPRAESAALEAARHQPADRVVSLLELVGEPCGASQMLTYFHWWLHE